MLSQMEELVARVNDALPGPWRKKVGRPKLCGLYEAVQITCMYMRHNATQEFLRDLRDTSQPTVSRYIEALIPHIASVLKRFVPDPVEAIQVVNGTITPCWSYADHPELWSRKHGTTGFNAQLVCLLDGEAVYVSDPLPGKTLDATAFTDTPVAEIVEHSGGAIADKGYQGHIAATPRKKPRGGELSSMDNNATPKSPHCERPWNDSSHTSNPGGSSTPTTAAHTAPTMRRTTPPVHFSSSRSLGVLNNLPSSTFVSTVKRSPSWIPHRI